MTDTDRKWHRGPEELPEENTRVLVMRDGRVHIGLFQPAEWDEAGPKWWANYDNWPATEPTWWMSLPQPPESLL